ncbi:amino acid ABC transporter ATP-binding protein [Halanaerobium congolense]|uniref:amino acid ABC transporter ATP-binding protein n=1 Tax=Halanaerobium congolense TaxID=54121 RepID=UPI002148CED2|nr:ATP-binding cassette domain-containing protein [Halanaerobium congolense]
MIFKGSLMKKNKKKQKELRKKIGIVFQHFNLFPHYSVLNNITNPLNVVNKVDKKTASNIAEKILNRVGLLSKRDNYPFQLSGGEKQRVAIARALAMDPDIIMFDEPTSALDPELSVEVFQTIKDLANEGMTMLIATHDINFVKEVVDRMIFIDKGKIVEMGPPDLMFSSPKKERTKKFLSNLIHY